MCIDIDDIDQTATIAFSAADNRPLNDDLLFDEVDCIDIDFGDNQVAYDDLIGCVTNLEADINILKFPLCYRQLIENERDQYVCDFIVEFVSMYK